MTETVQYRVLRLEIENFKRIVAVDITPEEDVVVVGGRNAQGKSSVLDALLTAVAGKRMMPDEPVRKGTKEARIVVDLGDIVIRWACTDKTKQPRLVVENSETGEAYTSPQKLLDGLLGRLFDPLTFLGLKPAEQRQVLLQAVGSRVEELDLERTGLFSDRTEVNRILKIAEAELKAAAHHTNAPPERISVDELMTALDNRRAHNDRREKAQQKVAASEKAIEDAREHITVCMRDLKHKETTHVAVVEALRSTGEPVDEDEIVEKIRSAGGENNRLSDNEHHDVLQKEAETRRRESDELTEAIKSIDEEKQAAIEEANIPVDGLSVDADGLRIHDVPFEQASQAEQLRTSTAIAMSLNPSLRVVVIRDGSLLDDASLELLRVMAKAHGFDIWIEVATRTSEGDDRVQVLIEDGEQKGGTE